MEKYAQTSTLFLSIAFFNTLRQQYSSLETIIDSKNMDV